MRAMGGNPRDGSLCSRRTLRLLKFVDEQLEFFNGSSDGYPV
jgi:hypothetical protein